MAAPKKEEQKNERYNRIAFEAAKQCGRGILPDVALPLPNFGGWSAAASTSMTSCSSATSAAAHPCASFWLRPNPPMAKSWKIAIITGAEGGFAVEEAEMAAKPAQRPSASAPASSAVRRPCWPLSLPS